ncbi:MAG: GatB/YqeY domain-containing protein [Bacteroidota bacterium]
MSLKQKIQEEMKTAMRAKDQVTLRTLRAIKTAIMMVETSEGFSGEFTEADELKLLTKQAKQRKDSIQQYRDNDREDLAKVEEEELVVIERFLPQQMSPAEIETEVKAIIAETGAASMRDMGKVMGLATKRMAGRADGKVISGIVRQLLA